MPPLILSATVNTTGTTFVPRTLSVSGGLVVGTPSSSYSTGEFSSGIGSEYITYSPFLASDLKINSNIASSSLSLACSTSYNPSVYFFAGTTSIASIYVDNSLASRPLVFQTPTKAPNAGGKFCLTKDGNVGIGTTSPSVYGSLTLASDIFVTATGYGGYARIFGNANQGVLATNSYWNGTNNLSAASGYSPQIDLRIDDGSIRFSTSTTVAANVATSLSESMRITSSGNVGIGTTAPNASLDVKGTLRLSGSTSGYVGFSPAAAAGSTTYTLPSADGTNGQVLSTNGSGTLSWASAGSSVSPGARTFAFMGA